MIAAVEEYKSIPILYSKNDSVIVKWDKKRTAEYRAYSLKA